MRLVAAAIAAILMLLGVAQPTVAQASRSSHYPRVYFEAGDATYLVYESDSGQHSGSLYARTKNGSPRRLGSDTAPSRSYLTYSLMGSLLTGGDEGGYGAHPIDTDKVLWWNLATHTSGRIEMPSVFDAYLETVPGGFLFYRSADSSAGYYRESIPSRRITKIRTLSSAVDVHAGPTGFVAELGKPDAPTPTHQLVFKPYGGGKTVALKIPHHYAHDQIGCQEVWQLFVRCFDYGNDGEGEYVTTLMLPLNGGKPFIVSTSSGPVALRRILVWGARHAHFRSPTGLVTVTKTRGRVQGEAFEEAITVNPAQTQLAALASARAAPVVVARA